MTDGIAVLGIDLGKNRFHLVGLNQRNRVVLRKRMNRRQLAEFAATLPTRMVAMEPCPGSQYWGRQFEQAGHQLRIIPAQFVKPFLKSNKNDGNDARSRKPPVVRTFGARRSRVPSNWSCRRSTASVAD